MKPRDVVWTRGDIRDLSGAATDSLLAIDQLVHRRGVAVDGATGWGQYLDELHWTDQQWGLLGTSMAAQVLARSQHPGHVDPQLQAATQLLPGDLNNFQSLHPRVQAKHNSKRDLHNIFRLAFLAEAQALDVKEDVVPSGHQPPISFDVEALARDGQSWHPRSAIPGERDSREGDAITTAYVLHSLRRFEHPPGRWMEMRKWLARQLLDDARLRARPDSLALVGLALVPPTPHDDDPAYVDEAVTRCRQGLRDWRKEGGTLVVNRPMFVGYNLGPSTDYLIFNPEVMAALLYLRCGNPRASRRFVAQVTRAATGNVTRHGGFEGQVGMVATVDQEWVSRLLALFANTWRDKARRHILHPVVLGTRKPKWGFYIGVAIISLGLLAALAGGFTQGWAAALVGALVTAAAVPLSRGEDE